MNLQEENERLKRLLHDLTPGGSEFYNDPEYCAKWIRDSREQNHYALSGIIKEQKRQKEELYKALDRAVGYLADLNGSNWITGEDAGSLDMKQRAKGLQSILYTALHNAKTIKPCTLLGNMIYSHMNYAGRLLNQKGKIPTP